MSETSQQTSMNPADLQQAEQARRQQINQIAEEIAQLSEADLLPAQYFSEFLQRIYFVVAAYAAAVWTRTPQGNLVLQGQINLREVNLDRTPESRPIHDELLRQAALQAKGGVIAPHFSHNFGTAADQIAGNPTDYAIILVPIMQDKKVAGILEVWQDPTRPQATTKALYDFMVRMSAFVSLFNRNHQLRQMLGQQELWLKLEAFARQVHNSLQVTECSYIVANEGRRLIEADRISVATRPNKKCSVTAISGADVVEKRSNLVQLMRKLFDSVVEWGEKLVYTGTKDDALPPKVLHALDAYLAESNSKILVIMPLQDERDKEKKRTARSAVMMECFETNLQPDQLMARLDVVGRHAAPALYNALEYKRIPMRFLWLPLAYVQDGLGGKAKAITTAVAAAVTLIVLAMIFVPFPLKMEAKGSTLPTDRINVYTPWQGTIENVALGLRSGSRVSKGQVLFTLNDFDLATKITDLQIDIRNHEDLARPKAANPADPGRNQAPTDMEVEKEKARRKSELLQNLRKQVNADLSHPGRFKVIAPRNGIVLTADLKDLVGKAVKPGEPLIRIGYTDVENPKLRDWEIELKIPQKNIGQIYRAFENMPKGSELDVDVSFALQPDAGIFRAKLKRDRIASQATTQKDEQNETETFVYAWARINPVKDAKGNDDIAADRLITPALLLSNAEVNTRIRCAYYPMGYSLFYGVYEFLYEKVVFPLSWKWHS